MGEQLRGLRVFIVEDEQLIVMFLEDMLADMGACVAAQASNVPDALALAEVGDFDIAILDLNLGGTKVFGVAELLITKGKPFVFATGYGARGIPPELAAYHTVVKPYQQSEVVSALRTAMDHQPASPLHRDRSAAR